MSGRRPGIHAELMFDPPAYDGQDVPEKLVEDLADWCGERHLYGGYKIVAYDEQGDVVASRPRLTAPAPLVWRPNDPDENRDAKRDQMMFVYLLPDGRLLLWDSRGSRNCVAGPFTIDEPGR